LNNKISSRELEYDLPENRVKQHPYINRENSKLLKVDSREIFYFKHILDILSDDAVLVLNKTTVKKRRVYGSFKDSTSTVEIFILNKINDNEIECLLKTNSKKQIGKKIIVDDIEIIITKRIKNVFYLNILNDNFKGLIDKNGKIPLPPYIEDHASKYDGYQTVFKSGGESVAAPTAGLHFTQDLLHKINKKGINTHFINLDIGLGTFSKITTEDISEHKIHKEKYHIDDTVLDSLINDKNLGKKIVTVGTSTLRALETCFSSRPYKPVGETNLFIKRGYEFKFCDGLITNFHAPKSTLLALIDAIVTDWKDVYTFAIDNEFNFLSFGDSMYIDIEKCKI